MHTHFPMAVFHLLQTDGIVEVLSIGWVDGDGEYFTEVAAAFDFVFADVNRNPIRFFFNIFWKLDGVFVCSQDTFHLNIVLAGLAEHADHLSEGVA